jgi:hypothetical protein
MTATRMVFCPFTRKGQASIVSWYHNEGVDLVGPMVTLSPLTMSLYLVSAVSVTSKASGTVARSKHRVKVTNLAAEFGELSSQSETHIQLRWSCLIAYPQHEMGNSALRTS